MESYSHLKEGEKGAWLSIVTYILLSVFKIGVGYYTTSEALTADGINNTTDIVASLAVLIGLRISRKPPDKDHPYGHRRAESIASLVASFIMAAVGIEVMIHASKTFLSGERPTPDMASAWVAILSAIVMWWVYMYNRRLANRVNSHSLKAAAQDNRSDVLVSIGTAVGIFGSQLGYPVMDSITAFVVGIIICKTAWEIFSEASHALTDGFDENMLNEFGETVKETPGVKRIKDIRARFHGSQVLLDVVVEVSGELSVEESHHISDEIEKRMLDEHRIINVHVHIEPYIEKRK